MGELLLTYYMYASSALHLHARKNRKKTITRVKERNPTNENNYTLNHHFRWHSIHDYCFSHSRDIRTFPSRYVNKHIDHRISSSPLPASIDVYFAHWFSVLLLK